MARIVNKMAPDKAELCASVEAAEAKLRAMLHGYEARGCSVFEKKDDHGLLWEVSDEQGRPIGMFYVDAD